MARVYSWAERLQRLDEAADALSDLRAQIVEARDFEIEARKTPFTPSEMTTRMTGRLAGVTSMIDNSIEGPLDEVSDNNSGVWQVVVRPAYVKDLDSIAVDATAGTLTANDGTPFSEFSDGDVVEISNAEDAMNNVQRTIDTGGATDTVLTFTTTMPSDNTDDESLTVTLVSR